MAIVVEKWFDEPIILLIPDAHVTEQELADAWFRSAELAQTIPGSAYRVLDLRSTNSPNAVVSWLRGIVAAMVGTPVTPLLRVSFVGSTAAASSAVSTNAETWFETLDEALSHIRTMAGVESMPS
jgi:hypothetical protein